jgi:hypothetical protein
MRCSTSFTDSGWVRPPMIAGSISDIFGECYFLLVLFRFVVIDKRLQNLSVLGPVCGDERLNSELVFIAK